MVIVLLQGTACNDVVVNVGEHKGQLLEQPVHEAPEVWMELRHPKGVKRYLNKTNGILIAVFDMSWGAIGI